MTQHRLTTPVNQLAIAVILGGGRGTRLWPLTKYRAKPAVPVAGKYRLIDIPISNCLNSGLDRIYILTQFNSSSLNRHITATYHLDPFSRGFVTLEAASQSNESNDWYQGTADSVRRNLKTIAQWQTANIVILPGDVIFRMDLRQLLEFHMEQKADITVALHPTGEQRAPAFGIARMDDQNRIIQIVEKPSRERLAELALPLEQRAQLGMNDEAPYLASMGIYIFRTEVLEALFQDASMNDFGHQILPHAVSRCKVSGYIFHDYWEDIGTIRSFYQTNLALVRTDPPFRFFYTNAPIYSRMRFLPSTQFGKVHIETTKIAEGCEIGDAHLDNCMIGIRSLIGNGVRMSRTIMMGGDYYEYGQIRSGFEPVPPDAPIMGIGDNCVIEGAIIDKNARVGAGVRIQNLQKIDRFDDPQERFYIRDGIVIVPKHAILEPGLII